MSERDCHHGEQARTCYRCELERQVSDLQVALAEEALVREQAEAQVERLRREAYELDSSGPRLCEQNAVLTRRLDQIDQRYATLAAAVQAALPALDEYLACPCPPGAWALHKRAADQAVALGQLIDDFEAAGGGHD